MSRKIENIAHYFIEHSLRKTFDAGTRRNRHVSVRILGRLFVRSALGAGRNSCRLSLNANMMHNRRSAVHR